MKTLFRISAVLFVLLLIALVGGYFTLTHAGFQKRLVEQQLPKGSSIEAIHVTTGHVTLSGLVLVLEDGTRVELGSIDTAFEPLAAVFDRTIKMGVLQVEGLRVDLPSVVQSTVTSGVSTSESSGTSPSPVEAAPVIAPTSPASGQASAHPMEALNALGNFEWLFDIDGIALAGVIYDGQGSEYRVRVDSPAIRPGESSTIDASLQLLTDVPLPSGLKAFDSSATLSFKQKQAGGFESLQLQSNTSGTDAQDRHLISLQQALELEVDDAAGVATVSLSFNADLPQPRVLLPELAPLGPLAASGAVSVSTNGEAMTLSAADLSVSAAGVERMTLDLKRSLVFGGEQDLLGDLLDVTISGLQLEWLNPWLSDGLVVQSQAPVSLALSVVGAADGVFSLTSAEPLQLGPLTVTEGGKPMLQDVVLRVAPALQLNADQSLSYALDSFNVADKYGSFIQGSSSGVIQLDAPRDALTPFAGVQAQAQLEVGLQELFQLPVLADSASIVSGQLVLDVSVDEVADAPLQLQAKIKGLRARSLPSLIRDYDLSLGLSPTSNPGELDMVVTLFAGPTKRPSTSIRFAATVDPSQQPMTFAAEVTAPRVTQGDLTILGAAFTPRESVATVPVPTPANAIASE